VTYLSMRYEITQNAPGEKDLGAPFLLLIFGIPALISGLLGLGFFIEFAIYRIRGKNPPE